MLSFNDLKDPKKLIEFAIPKKLPYNDKEMSLMELSTYLFTKYNEEDARNRFNKFVMTKHKDAPSHMVFSIFDENLMCLKVLTYPEYLLLNEIVHTVNGKIDLLKDLMYISTYTNEQSFSDAIHQLFIKQTFMKAKYIIQFDASETALDEEYYKA